MNQGFKLRFDQMREGNPASSNERGEDVDVTYTTPGHARNVCFVWPDGRKAFFNYAYLVGADFDPTTEQNVIKLDFSSHSVTISGYGLEHLFVGLLDHLPRLITAIDSRYVLAQETPVPVVMAITVKTDK